MYTQASLATLALSLFGSANAHMVMNTPTPYNSDTVSTSPLDGDTYQFPCQGGTSASYYSGATATDMTVGEDQTLAFTGSAVHGGGSCQLSITYEDPPSSDQSKWKVIKSIIGGCPALAAGNLASSGTDDDGRPDGTQCGNDSDSECVRQFTYQIPEKMKNGNATIAWTWFNKIGNREMYMNCAPISITGGSDDDDYYDSLPDMFIANIPDQCTTETGVLDFPNPGTVVEDGGDTASSSAIGDCATGLNTGSGSTATAGTTAGATSAAATSVASTVATTTPAVAVSVTASVGGVFAPSASSAAASYTATSLATIVVTQSGTPASVATPATAATPADSASTPSSSGSVSCSENGAIVCFSSTQYGICNWGTAIAQDVAAGTTCSDGQITKRDVGIEAAVEIGSMLKRNRSKRHAKQHRRAALAQAHGNSY